MGLDVPLTGHGEPKHRVGGQGYPVLGPFLKVVTVIKLGRQATGLAVFVFFRPRDAAIARGRYRNVDVVLEGAEDHQQVAVSGDDKNVGVFTISVRGVLIEIDKLMALVRCGGKHTGVTLVIHPRPGDGPKTAKRCRINGVLLFAALMRFVLGKHRHDTQKDGNKKINPFHVIMIFLCLK